MKEILNQTFFAIDIRSMLGDIEDFISFSESNINLQKQRELRKAEIECEREDFDDPQLDFQYKCQILEGVEYRFDISLTQTIRYAGLTGLVTTIEWCMLMLNKRASFEIKNKSFDQNDTVNTLKAFDIKTNIGLTREIDFISTLIHIRNCIVHAAGLLEHYEYSASLTKELEVIDGVSVSGDNYLGESIKIDPDFLEVNIRVIEKWLPCLEKVAHDKGLLDKPRKAFK